MLQAEEPARKFDGTDQEFCNVQPEMLVLIPAPEKHTTITRRSPVMCVATFKEPPVDELLNVAADALKDGTVIRLDLE